MKRHFTMALFYSALATCSIAAEAQLPKAIIENLKYWVYLDHDNTFRMSAIISEESFEVTLNYLQSKNELRLSSISLFYQSKSYLINQDVLPRHPLAISMAFKTENGIAFVLIAGGGEYVKYCLYEVQLNKKELVCTFWDRVSLAQVGKTEKLHLNEEQDSSPANPTPESGK